MEGKSNTLSWLRAGVTLRNPVEYYSVVKQVSKNFAHLPIPFAGPWLSTKCNRCYVSSVGPSRLVMDRIGPSFTKDISLLTNTEEGIQGSNISF